MPVTVASPIRWTRPADVTSDPSRHADDSAPFEAGAAVEVRNRFDGHWARGFEVVRGTDDGYRVRRHSDGLELPAAIARADVRRPRDRKRGTWWY